MANARLTMRARLKWAFLVGCGACLVAATAGCGISNDPAQQIAPGSAVVPAAQISAEVKAILPYYRFPFPADSTPLYGLETALAAKFGNVSNLDNPQDLASAEVNFEIAVQNDRPISQNQPFSPTIDTAIHALAKACGMTETHNGIIDGAS
jgi:hypothetical protein